MTSSPLLPPGRARRAAEHLTETEATDAELDRMTELALGRGALGTPDVISLVGAHNLPGLTGPTATGGTWHVSDGLLRSTAA